MKSLLLLLLLAGLARSQLVLDPSLFLQPSSHYDTNFVPSSHGALSTCPRDPSPSCPGTTSVDSCCSNTPGGYFVMTQFWDTTPPVGPADSWTIHGLWPDHCDGKTYDESCDSSRFYTNITEILEAAEENELLTFMKEYWIPDRGSVETFWQHEWNKHGTCISTMNPKCYGDEYTPQEEVILYFKKTVELFKTVSTYDFLSASGIVPSLTATYSLAQIQSAAVAHFGHEIIWGCKNGRYLNEAWWGYVTKGSVESGIFEPAARGGARISCPASGIKYLPKGASPSPPSPPGEPAPLPPGAPTGRFFVNVILSDDSEKGCLISNGKWLVGSTCAGYTVKSAGKDVFSLRTSKGECDIGYAGALYCGPGVVGTAFSVDSEGYFSLNGKTQFYAAEVPKGSNQIEIVTGKGAVKVKLHWVKAGRLTGSN